MLKLKYSLNEFLSQAGGSCEKAIMLFVFHVMCLRYAHTSNPTDADFTKMYERSVPLVEELQQKFTLVKSTEAAQISHTEDVKLRIIALQGETGLAHDWYDRVKSIYGKTNPVRFKAIFPKGLKPFKGKKDNIITAVGTLSLNIGSDINPLMVTLKAEVDATYHLINPSRMDQKEAIIATGKQWEELDNLCAAAMEMEHRNEGLLMDKFPKNENNIQESFHDMELLLGKQQTEWDVAIDPTTTKGLATRTLLAPIKLKGTSHFGSASLYLSSTAGGIDSTPVVFLEDIETKFTAADFHVTDYAVHRHLTLVNNNNVAVRVKLKIG